MSRSDRSRREWVRAGTKLYDCRVVGSKIKKSDAPAGRLEEFSDLGEWEIVLL